MLSSSPNKFISFQNEWLEMRWLISVTQKRCVIDLMKSISSGETSDLGVVANRPFENAENEVSARFGRAPLCGARCVQSGSTRTTASVPQSTPVVAKVSRFIFWRLITFFDEQLLISFLIHSTPYHTQRSVWLYYIHYQSILDSKRVY